ncbi:NADH-ubiquinone oxidoreductase chain M [hydrothermal vent metagenome]|uniref:NADH-ubiquinone oxidoreductase chain M n=1 Tax=hydrothermal vent metagenome TaxID=652676 RepID=A0A1W1BQB1_9ZZZZ
MRVLNIVLSLISSLIVIKLFNMGTLWQLNMSDYGLNGIVVGLEASPLSSFFAVLISFSWIIISLVLIEKSDSNTHFIKWLPLLTLSLFIIVYATDYLIFFIGWEVMSLSTYIILSKTLTQEALIKYIIFAMSSALSILMAIVILYSGEGTLLYIDGHESFIALSLSMKIALITFMLLGLFIKMGTIGFHYWVVDSYNQANNLFTAYLSAILSKMGIYALIIFLFQVVDIKSLETIYLQYFLAFMGVLTSIIATFKAIKEDEVKRLLAYSSIAQLGYILTVLAIANGLGGALYHAVIHTLVKLLLFINIAGVIAITGRSKLSELGGLIYRMPQSFVMLLIGIIVIAGMPPLGGFASKYLIYTSLLDAKLLLILTAMMFASVSAFLYVYKLIYGVYLGQPTNHNLEKVNDVSIWYLIPQYIISIILIIIGTFPALIVPYLNGILTQFNITNIEYQNSSILTTNIGSFNGEVVMYSFIGIFVIVLIFLSSLKSDTKNVKDRFDIAYCGEEPDANTPLHYGFSLGQELRRVNFINIIWQNSSSYFYNSLANITSGVSLILRKIYTGNLRVNFHIAIIFAILLLWWGR